MIFLLIKADVLFRQNIQPITVLFNGKISKEILIGLTINSKYETVTGVADTVGFYNNGHPNMSLSWMTQAEASLSTGELEKK